ncbi:MAG: right-handed parallel beta-helix repeat-containing protein, partial [Phycisphaeraceae bacterium]|nr:right-handed parallel beta-helix repeat-containing protein [Phycisphaeraceae bacterium]
IYHAMQVLHDGGGIYCFAGKNMVLRGNLIHDIDDTGGYGASAYYLDERSEDCVVEGNLSYNVAWPSHNHMALKNTIRNNVFVYDGDMQLTFPRSTQFLLEHNVIVATGSIKFTNVDALTLHNNVLFSGKGIVTGVHLKDYGATGQGKIEAAEPNTMADPKLLEYETGRIRFAPDSYVLKMGISVLDVSKAGRLVKD